MNVKWVNSSSVLSWTYCAMSESSSLSASVNALLPVPWGTSWSWIPHSSLYCCHRSVSRISAAARNRRMAASPVDRSPAPKAAGAADSEPTPSTVSPAPAMNRRRLVTRAGVLGMRRTRGYALVTSTPI